MRLPLGLLMSLNAVLFFFGAVQHYGVAIGSFHEPVIVPAAIVEGICGLSLAAGAAAVFARLQGQVRLALISNLIALAGVALGIVALAVGAGPRTPSNDLYHRWMLALIATSLLILWLERNRRVSNTSRART